MSRRTLAILLFSLLSTGRAVGQQLPAPTPLPPDPPNPPVVFLVPQSHSAYEHWQYRSVDRFGQYRTRIITTPEGAFRAADGAPFPWRSVYPLEYKPQADPSWQR